jgi:HlyD family secretion protein
MLADRPFETRPNLVDIPRKQTGKKRRQALALAAVALVVIAITAGLSRLRAAAPTVERGAVWPDTVKRGAMLRRVKGPGTLVPEYIRWITADTAGRIERIPLRPPARVQKGTVLMELSNPDVLLAALDAERQLAGAQADLLTLRNSLETARMVVESAIAGIKTDEADARRKADAIRPLQQQGTVSQIEARQTLDKSAEMGTRLAIEEQKLQIQRELGREQLAAQRAQIDRLRAVVAFRKQLVESMKVRSQDEGVLSELPLELGQWVTPGSLLAKVVKPEKLKAELRIPETQAKDLSLGQSAEVDTRNGIVAGKVARIAPSAKDGAVLIEVALEGALPRGARPDLTVEGTVEIEKLNDVLYVGRPAGAQEGSTVELFKCVLGTDEAVRTKVKFGKSSVSTIEVKDGLREGDTVVLSDMSAWDKHDRIRLK